MNAQSFEVIESVFPVAVIYDHPRFDIELAQIEVIDDHTCRLSMDGIAIAKDVLDDLNDLFKRRCKPHKLAILEEKSCLETRSARIEEYIAYQKGQINAYEEARLAFSTPDEPVEKIEGVRARTVVRKVKKVRVINKEMVPEKFKIVDEDKILEQHIHGGDLPLGISPDGSFEIYEEEIKTHTRKG